MSYYWFCDCLHYVEATPCEGSSNIRVVVQNSDLPATTTIFSYNSECWIIDPNDSEICWASDMHRVTDFGDTYESCVDCESDTESSESSGGTGGGDGWDGGGWSGWGGADNGTGGSGGDGESSYVKLVECSGHSGRYTGSDLYAPTPSETAIINYNGTCFTVPTSPTYSEVPSGGISISFGGSFDACSDCTDGIKATLCPDQESLDGYGDTPDIWCRLGDVPTGDITFLYNNFCYELSSSDNSSVIPLMGIVFSPSSQFDDCDSCGLGIQAELCDSNATYSKEVWVEENNLPSGTGYIYFRYAGLCWALNLDEDVSRITPDAETTIPQESFESCADCDCGEPTPETGKMALICPGQNIAGGSGVWIKDADVPSGITYFSYNGICYFLDSSSPSRDIPVDATICVPTIKYRSCTECIPSKVISPPGYPPGTGGEYELLYCRKLTKCTGSEGTLPYIWVLEHDFTNAGLSLTVGKVYNYSRNKNACYEVTSEQSLLGALSSVQGLPYSGPYNSCTECLTRYKITNCESPYETYLILDDLSAYDGRVIKVVDKCWEVESTTDNGEAEYIKDILGDYADCDTCLNPTPLTCADCPSGAAGSATVTLTGTFTITVLLGGLPYTENQTWSASITATYDSGTHTWSGTDSTGVTGNWSYDGNSGNFTTVAFFSIRCVNNVWTVLIITRPEFVLTRGTKIVDIYSCDGGNPQVSATVTDFDSNVPYEEISGSVNVVVT